MTKSEFLKRATIEEMAQFLAVTFIPNVNTFTSDARKHIIKNFKNWLESEVEDGKI